MIPLTVAEDRAKRLCRLLKPFCLPDKLRIVGSIRRKKAEVKDIDLVCIFRPRGAVDLLQWLRANRNVDCAPGTTESMPRQKKAGAVQMQLTFEGTQVDLYFATPETWAVIGLIRTGSVEHNKRLCAKAKNLGWHFQVGGARPGIYDKDGKKVAGDTEAEFFKALGMEYLPPHRRG